MKRPTSQFELIQRMLQSFEELSQDRMARIDARRCASYYRRLAQEVLAKEMPAETDLLQLVDGAYDLVEIWEADSPYQKQWKRKWLRRAKALGAIADWCSLP